MAQEQRISNPLPDDQAGSPAAVSDACPETKAPRQARDIGGTLRGNHLVGNFAKLPKDSVSSLHSWDFPCARGVFATTKLEQLSAA